MHTSYTRLRYDLYDVVCVFMCASANYIIPYETISAQAINKMFAHTIKCIVRTVLANDILLTHFVHHRHLLDGIPADERSIDSLSGAVVQKLCIGQTLVRQRIVARIIVLQEKSYIVETLRTVFTKYSA